MKALSDRVVANLTAHMQAPDLTGTRYTLVRYLARGGMGSVWLVEDTVLDRRLALKVLDLIPSGDGLASRLVQEARVLASLEHPGIVPVHDAGTLADGRAFYCMKYVEGQTLASHIVGMELPEKLRLLERIAEPLQFAHSRGFIHRDLKPENIMIGAFGEVLVMDWGLAKVGLAKVGLANAGSLQLGSLQLGSPDPGAAPLPEHSGGENILASHPLAATAEGSVLGTPGYMSPEQMRGDSLVDHRTDIFSLGAILQFILTAPASPRPKSSHNLPRVLRAVSAKAMSAEPGARYQSVGDMAADIARYLNGAPVSAYPEGLFERAARIYSRNRTAVVLIAVYLLMRILFILFARH